MAIVTLTTDWGVRDFFAGAVKGKLLSAIPGLDIIDITHHVEPHNIAEAAFILRHAYPEFPEGSIHIVSLRATASRESPHVAIKLDGHYFIGTDNGLLGLLSDNKPEEIVEIDIPQDSNYFVFPGRDIFVKSAIHLAQDKSIKELGFNMQGLQDKSSWSASVDKDPETGNDRISGRVIHVDNYGNCLTNIKDTTFQQMKKNRSFRIYLPATTISQTKLYDAYDEVDEGKILVLMSSTGFLQIAINQGRANRLLGLEAYDSSINVEFINS
ncbi:MAG: SAM-dependent chlorinase/fluorinase [Bacteroidales bacterium]|nr:SAM-dependent chlorinase/fluorinase [Bacteroidales bacterium]